MLKFAVALVIKNEKWSHMDAGATKSDLGIFEVI